MLQIVPPSWWRSQCVENSWRNENVARLKRTSQSAQNAQIRANALAGIDPNLDLGNGLTVPAYQASINAISDPEKGSLAAYNGELSKLDGMLDSLENQESALDDLSGRMLAAVGAKYGKDSKEYEMAGGTRTSERAAPQTQAQKAAAKAAKEAAKAKQ